MDLFEKLSIVLVGLYCFGCTHSEIPNSNNTSQYSRILCDEEGCNGSYKGAEFIAGSDVAHQFSNEMSDQVGNKLKELYNDGIYSKVDFSRIKMSTKGMGSGTVEYKLYIPFKRVQQKCDAFTSFDHSGGWNHTPELSARKIQLQSALLKGDSLQISSLKRTPEGLQEYWIQWKNKQVQSECEDK